MPLLEYAMKFLPACGGAFVDLGMALIKGRLACQQAWCKTGIVMHEPGLARLYLNLPVGIAYKGFAIDDLVVGARLMIRGLARPGRRVMGGLVIGAALLTLSLTFRTLDAPLCAALPLGTHFLWHILNAVMLGWMIAVYVSHRKEAG